MSSTKRKVKPNNDDLCQVGGDQQYLNSQKRDQKRYNCSTVMSETPDDRKSKKSDCKRSKSNNSMSKPRVIKEQAKFNHDHFKKALE